MHEKVSNKDEQSRKDIEILKTYKQMLEMKNSVNQIKKHSGNHHQ
jgi:hypothetical protein